MSVVASELPYSRLRHVGPHGLEGMLTIPRLATGIVLFAHGSGSSRLSPRNVQVAQALQKAGLAALLIDLLTPEEAKQRSDVFDIALLSVRINQAVAWLKEQPETKELAIGLFGASTGAAAAVMSAAQHSSDIVAVVSRGGRPDLAFDSLHFVRAPTLLIVGGADTEVVHLNRRAYEQLTCERQMRIIPHAGHLFEKPGAMDAVTNEAVAWFTRWLKSTPRQAKFDDPFLDRSDAGRRLASQMTDLKADRPIVYALPRGGVPVAFEIAKRLGAPLDLILVRKIGVPNHPELAVGALVDGEDPELVVNESVMRWEGLSRNDVEVMSKSAILEIERRRIRYFQGRARPEAKHRVAIVVDDGLATGATMRVALQALRKRKPKRIIVAAPVASADAIKRLKDVADEVRVLLTPPDFRAVGLHYLDFTQVTDEQVIALLGSIPAE